MGEIADDIINGFQCSWCGICFEEEHGYPVACNDCWEEALKNEIDKKTKMINCVQKAIYKEL